MNPLYFSGLSCKLSITYTMVSALVIVGIVGIVVGVMCVIYGMKQKDDPKCKDSMAWFGAAAMSGVLLILVISLMMMSHVSSGRYKQAV